MKKVRKKRNDKNEALVFAGELDVQDDAFTLQADRLILRKNALAFALSGRDVYGHFQIDGVASPVAGGRFATLTDTPLKPRGFDGIERARLVFNEVTVSPKKRTCRVKGLWRDLDEAWIISGLLTRAKINK